MQMSYREYVIKDAIKASEMVGSRLKSLEDLNEYERPHKLLDLKEAMDDLMILVARARKEVEAETWDEN